ncbi:MAG: YkgJ family cysteine cluster protein [Candidatus Bathyarchaeia archaeon]
MVKFKCTLCGVCCGQYWVPVTHLDVWRILHYGGYDTQGFLMLYRADSYKSSFPKVSLWDGEGYLGLKRFPDGFCVFNKNKICIVHQFKPLTCRFYPFIYVTSNGRVTSIEVNKSAVKVCPGLIYDNDYIDPETYNSLVRLAEIRMTERSLYAEAVREWSSEYRGRGFFKKLLDFLIEKAEDDANILMRRGLWIK